MGPLVLIITAELILATGVLTFSSHPKLSNILGVQIAQEEAPAAENTSPPPAPAAEPPPAPPPESLAAPTSAPAPSVTSDTPTPGATSPAPESSPADSAATPTSSSTVESGTPQGAVDTTTLTPSEESKPLFEMEVSPNETPVQTQVTPTPQSGNPSTEAIPSQEEAARNNAESNTQTAAVLNGDEVINSPENINNQSVEEVKKEESQIEKTSDPKEQTKLLLTFATDKIKDMSNFTKADDFSSTNFAASRFNEQIDQAISNLDKLPKKDQLVVKLQLLNFCQQADQVLRSVELSVPQESEQDMQIARGQCQELNL